MNLLRRFAIPFCVTNEKSLNNYGTLAYLKSFYLQNNKEENTLKIEVPKLSLGDCA